VALDNVLTDRYVRWVDELYDWGYEILGQRRDIAHDEFVVRARRPACFGAPAVLIDVREVWRPGPGPKGVKSMDGFVLASAAWHAQFPGTPADVWAERLDVDPAKEPALRVHRHPLGKPNAVIALLSPEAWLEEIDGLVLDWRDQ